jgi:hypothetical protein
MYIGDLEQGALAGTQDGADEPVHREVGRGF